MDPFFFSSGFSDRWFELILPKFGFNIISITPVGDYYRWMAVELFRSIRVHKFASLIILPSFVFFMLKKKTEISQNTLCMGYHIVAIKS